MKRLISYRKLLEGLVKFNVIILMFIAVAIVFGELSLEQYYIMLGRQLLLVFMTVSFAYLYMRYRHKENGQKSISRESLCVGVIISIVCTYLYVLYVSGVPFDWLLWIFFTLSLFMGLLYWIIIVALSGTRFLNFIIKFLDIDFTYKDFVRMILILNGLFALILLVICLIVPSSNLDRDIFASLFVIIYFEAGFFVIHFVVAKIVDMFWHKDDRVFSNASMLGLFLGSAFYIVKINVIDQSVLHLFYFDSVQGTAPLVAWLVLAIFWTFFAMLFHFEVKYPLHRFSKKRNH